MPRNVHDVPYPLAYPLPLGLYHLLELLWAGENGVEASVVAVAPRVERAHIGSYQFSCSYAVSARPRLLIGVTPHHLAAGE